MRYYGLYTAAKIKILYKLWSKIQRNESRQVL